MNEVNMHPWWSQWWHAQVSSCKTDPASLAKLNWDKPFQAVITEMYMHQQNLGRPLTLTSPRQTLPYFWTRSSYRCNAQQYLPERSHFTQRIKLDYYLCWEACQPAPIAYKQHLWVALSYNTTKNTPKSRSLFRNLNKEQCESYLEKL